MIRRSIAFTLSSLILTFVAIILLPATVATQQGTAVRPSTVARMQNLELDASASHRPTYIPAEWGKLVSVQRLDDLTLELFLQAENGDIYLVRLAQQGQYFYLDTSDKGGVALIIKRQP